jgi:hypothetical protein
MVKIVSIVGVVEMVRLVEMVWMAGLRLYTGISLTLKTKGGLKNVC